jgi:hypothetical protein
MNVLFSFYSAFTAVPLKWNSIGKGEPYVKSSRLTRKVQAGRQTQTIRAFLTKMGTVSYLPVVLVLGFAISQIQRSYGQGKGQPHTPSESARASLDGPAQPSPEETGHSVDTTGKVSTSPQKVADPAIPEEVTKELELMKARIEELESQLKTRAGAEPKVSTATAAPETTTGLGSTSSSVEPVTQSQNDASAAQSATSSPPAVDTQTPFAYADWTWLNGTARNKDAVWDSKFFTPEIRFDTHFVSSFNHPKDDTIGGSSEIFRSNEIQAEQISFGGDFHWQNVRGRVLTMFGMFAVTTPRNDASTGRGQWANNSPQDMRNAYRYVSEAYGGYHWNVNHGLNVDAGIFVSYIGLFSYYNFDNWAYQPSYVSSNTPWFFNGLRIQWFPTNKLKIEPWIINGWQSYARFGNKPGLGGQILYRPKPWLSLVFNNYGMGEDTLGLIGRSRIHTDDSVEVKYYDRPEKTLDKMAFSFTGDLGCEYGGGAACFGDKKDASGNVIAHKQAFLGWMAYNRFWFKKDLYGLTIGGGQMSNPGRYLTLIPPINGADAISGTPYFTANPGDPFKAWDTSITFDYMPKQYITFRSEYGYRHASVPYFVGRGGITPPGGNTGTPSQPVILPDGSTWQPDLRKDEASLRLAIMVKF